MKADESFAWKYIAPHGLFWGVAVYGGHVFDIWLEDLSYIDAASLGGCALIPGWAGGLLGYLVYWVLRGRRRTSIIAGAAVGAVTYALLVSMTAEPISQTLPFGADPSNPVRAAVIAGVGGSMGGLVYVWKSRGTEKIACSEDLKRCDEVAQDC